MILTCHDCSRQLCFSGRDRRGVAAAFGWSESRNKFFCVGCARQLVNHAGTAVQLHAMNHRGEIEAVLPSWPADVAVLEVSPPCILFTRPASRLAEVG